MYYLNGRYYDPAVGRFINADNVELLGVNGDLASYNLFVYCGNNPILRLDATGNLWELAVVGGGSAGFGVGISMGALKGIMIAGMSSVVPIAITVVVIVVAVEVIEAVNDAQTENASDADDRITSPIGRRKYYNSHKKAKEAAKKAGGGKEPIKHPKGSHGNKKPHYHPNVKEKYRVTPHGVSSHDHYYYPR